MREKEREREREWERQRLGERESERDRERETERDRQTVCQRDRVKLNVECVGPVTLVALNIHRLFSSLSLFNSNAWSASACIRRQK